MIASVFLCCVVLPNRDIENTFWREHILLLIDSYFLEQGSMYGETCHVLQGFLTPMPSRLLNE